MADSSQETSNVLIQSLMKLRAKTSNKVQTTGCESGSLGPPNNSCDGHQRTGRGGWGGCSPPCRKKISIIRAKLMYRSGKDTVKNILLFNILIYLFSSRNSPNLLTDLCTTSRDGCYYSELEH